MRIVSIIIFDFINDEIQNGNIARHIFEHNIINDLRARVIIPLNRENFSHFKSYIPNERFNNLTQHVRTQSLNRETSTGRLRGRIYLRNIPFARINSTEEYIKYIKTNFITLATVISLPLSLSPSSEMLSRRARLGLQESSPKRADLVPRIYGDTSHRVESHDRVDSLTVARPAHTTAFALNRVTVSVGRALPWCRDTLVHPPCCTL